MAKDKKEPKRQSDEGGGILIPVLVAAMICVALTTTFIVGYGLQYTAEQRAIEPQQSASAAPVRSIPSPSESPVKTVSAPPEDSEPQQVEESTQSEGSQPVTPSPSASPSTTPSETPRQSETQTPESQIPASQPVQSNTTQGQTGNSGGGRGNADNFYTYDNPEQQNTDAKWVLNTSSKKIHYPNCGEVKKIAPKNYSESNLSESELLGQGYTTCKKCH